ncbi:hypothetical protein MSG28_009555 [Choristoneura fumiferana]|uniref:Uncharacterized protein n=1 Tax=Choristoneura fumiferana TaxID=7141 RepID=A0ACC0JBQ3_CHOFU|nr:hypothetical protein MSG28_009555 [Choristoneura fumiferana]
MAASSGLSPSGPLAVRAWQAREIYERLAYARKFVCADLGYRAVAPSTGIKVVFPKVDDNAPLLGTGGLEEGGYQRHSVRALAIAPYNLGLQSGGNVGTNERPSENVVESGVAGQSAGARGTGEAMLAETVHWSPTRNTIPTSSPALCVDLVLDQQLCVVSGSIKVLVLGEGYLGTVIKIGTFLRAMERSILGVRRTDRIRNTILRSKTRVTDVGVKTAKLKWDWAGHVCRMHPDRWARIVTEWDPRDGHRSRGRPKRRLRDDLSAFQLDWLVHAQNREEWRRKGEAFAQQWDIIQATQKIKIKTFLVDHIIRLKSIKCQPLSEGGHDITWHGCFSFNVIEDNDPLVSGLPENGIAPKNVFIAPEQATEEFNKMLGRNPLTMTLTSPGGSQGRKSKEGSNDESDISNQNLSLRRIRKVRRRLPQKPLIEDDEAAAKSCNSTELSELDQVIEVEDNLATHTTHSQSSNSAEPRTYPKQYIHIIIIIYVYTTTLYTVGRYTKGHSSLESPGTRTAPPRLLVSTPAVGAALTTSRPCVVNE